LADKSQVWEGQLTLGRYWARFEGMAGDNRSHRHFCGQLAWSKRGNIYLESVNGKVARGEVIGVEPNEPHRLMPQQGAIVLLYVEPTISASVARADAVLSKYLRDARRRSESGFRSLGNSSFWKELLSLEALSQGRDTSLRQIDSRLLQVVNLVASNLHSPLRHPDLSAAVQLSPSRLSHLFREQLGIPVRRYVLWERLRVAAIALSQGGTATQAAHRAGFADSAHFTRTLTRAFGVTPMESLVRFTIVVESGHLFDR
jgi:AraC-like DNA-binding protein